MDGGAGAALFGGEFAAVLYDAEDRPAIVDGDAPFFLFSIDHGVYRAPENHRPGLSVSFHPVDGRDDLWIAQIREDEKGPFEYYLARAENDRLVLIDLAIDEETLPLAEARGVAMKGSIDRGYSIDSRAALVELVDIFIEVHGTGPEAAEDSGAYFRIGRTEEGAQRIVSDSLNANCLALAGYPLDPSLKDLAPDYRDGVAFEAIKPVPAGSVCETAMNGGASPSVQLAYARAQAAGKHYSAFTPILMQLVHDAFGPAYPVLAGAYLQGLGVDKNPGKAVDLLREGAAAGLPAAQFALASYIGHGLAEGSPRDALKLDLEAHAGGLAPAATAAGVLLQSGDGIPHDPERAYALFTKAAEAGDLEALYRQGFALANGIGVAKDPKLALEKERAAADRDYAPAQYTAGFMLARGQGAEVDLGTAAGLLKSAMTAGNEEAGVEYGLMLYTGRGVKSNREEGLRLISEAAAKGNETALYYKRQIEKARESDAPDIAGLPDPYAGYVQKLWSGESFGLSERNGPFLAGLTDVLHQACDLPKSAEDATLIVGFVTRQSLGTLASSHAGGGAPGGPAQQLAGERFARTLGCGPAAGRLMDGAVEVIRAEAQADTFVKGCTGRYTETQCQCIAGVFSSVQPNIRRATFSRRTMEELIGGNPLLGVTVGFTCGVTEY